MPAIQDLKQFEIADTLHFEESENALTRIVVNNDFSDAEIYLHGANLVHFQPKGDAPVIYNGKETLFSASKTVHAGIPVCWPWFGPHPTESAKPQHGFARDMCWQLKSARELGSGETEIVLSLQESPQSLEIWPYAFELELTFTIGRSLNVALKTTNTSAMPFTITQALHSYFYIGDIASVTAGGVEGTSFVDYTDGRREKIEADTLQINRMVNRVYVPTKALCTLSDPLLRRNIVIEKEGSESTTIWNPWHGSGIHDLPGDAYRKFLCIETTNALSDARTLQPGATHLIVQKISLEAL